MVGHDIIVIGASAGGVEALCQLVRALPPDLPAAIFVVLHIPSQGTSVLPNILNRTRHKRYKDSSLQAAHAKNGEAIEHGRIYVAPPDQHLLLKDGYIRLARGPKENSHRPAVDPLFRTAAQVYNQRVVGVVLSGALDDGTAGLVAVKKQGGVAVVQDPDEALYSGMPSSAIENVDVDHILRVADIATLLVNLAYKPVEPGVEDVSRDMKMESDMAELELTVMQDSNRPGTPSPFACPECAGVLWELDEGGVLRFRCRTGHAYSVGTLLAEQSEALEAALWTALRALEEKASLVQRMASRARDRNQPFSAKRFEEQGQDMQQRATLVRQMLLKGEGNGQVVDTDGSSAVGNGHVVAEPEKQGKQEERGKFTPDSSLLHVVAITTSDGGLKALSHVLSALPADFPAAVVVVQHLSPQYPSQLADILGQRTSLSVKEAEQGDWLQPGKVYIAPPDQHLLVNPDATLGLLHSELVHFVRPSADLLFESVAAKFKERVIAVVLTGKGKDGTVGVQAIKKMGGKAIAQDQATSEYFGMPESAIATGSIDWVLPLDKIAATLMNLLTEEKETGDGKLSFEDDRNS
jgi:two-component system chemotaxis response regulator CheB